MLADEAEPWLEVVGIGEDGFAGLDAGARAALADADRIFGAARHIALLPQALAIRASAWPSPLLPVLADVLVECRGRRTAVLASGDPLFYGLGATIARSVPAAEFRIHPKPSSLALACARLGWAHEDVAVVSAVARPLERVHGVLAHGRRLVVLSQDGATPAALAALLVDAGYAESSLRVFERLGGPAERTVERRANDVAWRSSRVADLNVVAVALVADVATRPRGIVPGLPDDAFDHDGQLTKRDVRALTLGRLAPRAGEVLWDVGAGAGSISIEWMRAHPACRAVAFERDATRGARLLANARKLGTPEVRLIAGEAPASFRDAPGPAPDAIFLGGGVSANTIAACLDALRHGGRFVANAVTLGGEAALLDAYEMRGGELTRIAIDCASRVGLLNAWRPTMPIVQWSLAT